MRITPPACFHATTLQWERWFRNGIAFHFLGKLLFFAVRRCLLLLHLLLFALLLPTFLPLASSFCALGGLISLELFTLFLARCFLCV